jgi:hypothetical protein
VESLKTTAGAMLISAAFLAFRPMMASSEIQMQRPSQVAREDATDGRQPCPRPAGDTVESVAVVESDEVRAVRCGDRRDTAESTAVAAVLVADLPLA